MTNLDNKEIDSEWTKEDECNHTNSIEFLAENPGAANVGCDIIYDMSCNDITVSGRNSVSDNIALEKHRTQPSLFNTLTLLSVIVLIFLLLFKCILRR